MEPTRHDPTRIPWKSDREARCTAAIKLLSVAEGDDLPLHLWASPQCELRSSEAEAAPRING